MKSTAQLNRGLRLDDITVQVVDIDLEKENFDQIASDSYEDQLGISISP